MTLRGLCGSVMLLAGLTAIAPALARGEDVWRVYPVEGGGGSLAALPAEEVDSPEPYWRFVMTCIPGERWDATVSGIDAAALGRAIAGGEAVQISVIADGDPNKVPLSGYFPEIAFGQMYGEWEYSAPFDLVTLDVLGEARSLAVTGTGVDFALPSEGTAEAFAEFRALCAALPPSGG
ncbi:MAG TPA: hypothetical protein VFK86_06500 [Bauldia sp.]|nr:hypothetical protein [Bauldia sp.]